jgi:N-acetylglutamate synthase-like GNAT family acetyltransferase
MWIKPEYIRAGVGRRLFEHVRVQAEDRHLSALELSADPNAEGFYQRMGAVRIGEVRADIAGQARILPRMRIELEVPPSGASLGEKSV